MGMQWILHASPVSPNPTPPMHQPYHAWRTEKHLTGFSRAAEIADVYEREGARAMVFDRVRWLPTGGNVK